jgi:hypothetical protein
MPSKSMQKRHFSIKKHAFAAKMVDGKNQAIIKFEGL